MFAPSREVHKETIKFCGFFSYECLVTKSFAIERSGLLELELAIEDNCL
jgi:hypothetical protein